LIAPDHAAMPVFPYDVSLMTLGLNGCIS